MEVPVQRVEQLWAGEGIAIWATDQAGRLILEFDDEAVCEAACGIQALLKRHALNSSFLERLDRRSLLIRRVAPLGLQAVVESSPGETRLTYQGTDGQPLSPEEAKAVEGVSAKRLEMMEDVATHAARSLRAHLTPHGVERLRLTVRFGVAEDGTCLPQVVNPLNCELGTTDMERLANLLGG
ncbi:MAG: hypothetical protein ACOY94_15970 [Bacillota bacterium]